MMDKRKQLPKVVLVVGHAKESKGAYNAKHNVAEFDFNQKLALGIKYNALTLGATPPYEVAIFYRENGYGPLPFEVNEHHPDADMVISLHANAFNGHASGCETLYHHQSELSRGYAEIFQTHLVATIGNKDRGLKPKTSEDRGGHLLAEVDAPCILVEPFFIDNIEETERALDLLHSGDLAEAFDKAIVDCLEQFSYNK